MMSTDDYREQESLLAELRSHDTVDADALERVRERVHGTLTSAHLAALGDTTTTAPRSTLPARMWRAARGTVASSLLVGVALGAGGHALVREWFAPASTAPESPASATAATQPHPARLAAAAAPAATLELAPSPAVAHPVDSPETRARTAPSSSGGLSTELAALESARRALAAGTPARALQQLTAHAQRYPRSMLAQERDALVIKSLVAMGRHAEARAAGARFDVRYPNGLLRPAVEAALASIP